MADEEFDFEAELALLDVGATTSLLKAGAVRPTVIGYTGGAGVEAMALDWQEGNEEADALEEARRCLRKLGPRAYGVVASLERAGSALRWLRPGQKAGAGHEFLGILLVARDGRGRSLLYPVRRPEGPLSFGMPTVTDAAAADWCPLGDIWANPYCAGDLVRFARRERPVEPGTPLWQSLVDLTRMRIQQDQANAHEYMSFLDDLRNGLMVVSGRPASDPGAVLLRPRTAFNPVGTLTVPADRLEPVEDEAAESVGAS